MKSNSKTNKIYDKSWKKWQVLEAALEYLDVKNADHPKGKYEFVCCCIGRITGCPYEDRSGLIEIIENRLTPYNTFNTWLNSMGINYSMQNINKGKKLQATRKAWMLSMIEEFKSKDE